MFAAIAPSYDLNNRVHSLWIDQYWRRQTVRLAGVKPTDTVIDVACGTGDLTFAFARAKPAAVCGVDFTYEMLPIARSKSARESLPLPVRFATGDAQSLPFLDGSADVVSIAFGIRNVQSPWAAIREFRRVLRPGGRLVILEFSVPTQPVFRSVYNFYCSRIMPLTATWLSGDRSGAYRYLPHSVETFVTPEQMKKLMAEAGFADVTATPLTFGAVVVYRGLVTG
jgi:demethylmenaquinone methyltransferase/2-methoxy-6-polyprenyl-1,4-benzoquinol methylase